MRIRDYLGPIAGIVISAICFGIYHGNMIQFIYAGILGLFLSFGMEKSQTVLVPIVGHMVANFWSMAGLSVVTSFIGDNKTYIAVVDIVMVLIFLSGLSLMGFKGKKKKTQDTEPVAAAEKTTDRQKKDAEPMEISAETIQVSSAMPQESVEKELEAELKAAEKKTELLASVSEITAEPDTASEKPETASEENLQTAENPAPSMAADEANKETEKSKDAKQ